MSAEERAARDEQRGRSGPSNPAAEERGSGAPAPQLAFRVEAGRPWPVHVWRFDRPLRVISCGPYGGGLGERRWVLNASVPRDYDRRDPDAHIAALAAELGLAGPGTGMLTAVNVSHAVTEADEGVSVVATVGLGYPTRAAAPAEDADPAAVGTINIVAFLPVPLADAALVNAVATVTEAKVQALAESGIAATGTATDALVIACPVPDAGDLEPYGGPRSTWGSRLARAAHGAVVEGTRRWRENSRSR